MSKFHVETIKSIVIDGIKRSARIDFDEYVDINFSAARYTISMWEDACGAAIEFIPDNMDFLHELTEIFPLSEYDYKIIQGIYRHTKPHISLHLNIKNKETGEKIYFADSVILSDNDYDYIRDILVKEVPQYDWRAAEGYIRDSIESFMGDGNITDLFTNDAWNYLSGMVSARYKEFKTDGYVDFEDRGMKEVAKEILENALRNAYELQNGMESKSEVELINSFEDFINNQGVSVGYRFKQLDTPEEYFNQPTLCGIFHVEQDKWLFVHQDDPGPGENPAIYLSKTVYTTLFELIESEKERISRKIRIAQKHKEKATHQ